MISEASFKTVDWEYYFIKYPFLSDKPEGKSNIFSWKVEENILHSFTDTKKNDEFYQRLESSF